MFVSCKQFQLDKSMDSMPPGLTGQPAAVARGAERNAAQEFAVTGEKNGDPTPSKGAGFTGNGPDWQSTPLEASQATEP